MDDLAKKLNDLLNSPDGMQKIQAAASSLGILTGNNSNSTEEKNASSAIDSLTASLSPTVSEADGNPLGDMELISKLMPLISNLHNDDQNTILLKALRPYLQDERQHRLDESIKILQLLKVLPLLNDKDIL